MQLRRATFALLAFVAIAVVTAPAQALAADGTIDFSTLANGTDVSTQYQNQDAVFGQSLFWVVTRSLQCFY